MRNYILRRCLYALPILFGVNVITFVLFFIVNSPDDMARFQLGERRVTPVAVENWKQQRGYDRPLFWNANARGLARVSDTIFFRSSRQLFTFDFGQSDAGRDIGFDIKQRMGPSLAIAVPVTVVALLLCISIALIVAVLQATYIDTWALMACVAMMSISTLFYIIGGQYVIGKLLKLVPISGYDDGLAALKFLLLPIGIGVLGRMGSEVRWYRTIFLEEIGKEYVRAARAKGISEVRVLLGHVLRNALIPIVTNVVALLPLLFLGSLITEAFFAIPGLGSYTIDAIQGQDFAIVRTIVFLGSCLYIVGLLATDLAYTVVDPNVRFA